MWFKRTLSPGDGSPYVVPVGSWVRVPMPCAAQKVCIKICRCGNKGLSDCQPLPSVALDNCRLHDKVVKHGKYLGQSVNKMFLREIAE